MMKKGLILIFIMTLLSNNSFAQSEIANLEVKVINIPNNDGQMIISLHHGASDFPKAPYAKIMGDIVKGTSNVIFENLPFGNYAITVVHDENKNNKLDFNFLHIPTEDAAASNNAKGFMGPPKYEDAEFEVMRKNVSQMIELTKNHSSLN